MTTNPMQRVQPNINYFTPTNYSSGIRKQRHHNRAKHIPAVDNTLHTVQRTVRIETCHTVLVFELFVAKIVS